MALAVKSTCRSKLSASSTGPATPIDRAAFVNIEGFFLIPDHAKGHVEEEHKPGEKEEPEEVRKIPLPEDQREATAVLVRTASIGGRSAGTGCA